MSKGIEYKVLLILKYLKVISKVLCASKGYCTLSITIARKKEIGIIEISTSISISN